MKDKGEMKDEGGWGMKDEKCRRKVKRGERIVEREERIDRVVRKG